MKTIVVKKSSFKRVVTLLSSAKFPSSSSFATSFVFDSVYLDFDSTFDLTLASSALFSAGILHRVSIM